MENNIKNNITIQQTSSLENELSQISKEIMRYYLDPLNIPVREFYNEDNIWKFLKIERDENRHSAFLGWFLNLDYENSNAPIYRFVALLVSKMWGKDDVDNNFIKAVAYHKLKIKNIVVDTEKFINELTTIQYKDRIDIFISGQIEGCDPYQKIEIIIENKVGSSEGGPKNKKEIIKKPTYEDRYYSDLHQTCRYYYACAECRNNYNSEKTLQLYVFLTPNDESPKSEKFIKVSYQDLVDHLFEPYKKSKDVNEYAKNAVTDYMRILCDPHNKYNLIMATMEEEKKLFEDFYERNKELFKKALSIKKKLAEEAGDEESAEFYSEQEKIMNERDRRPKPSFIISYPDKSEELKKPALWQPAAKVIAFLINEKNYNEDTVNTLFKEVRVRGNIIMSKENYYNSDSSEQGRRRQIENTDYYISTQFSFYETINVPDPNFKKFMDIVNNKIDGVTITATDNIILDGEVLS